MPLSDWLGRTQTVTADIAPWPAAALHATLDLPGPTPDAGDTLPPLWSWLYFLDAVAEADLGIDGHPHKGGFLPPVELPRRMWAGSTLEFLEPLVLGERYARTSTVADIAEKSGRSGRLCFVTVNHEIEGSGRVHVRERQTVVYREPPPPSRPANATASTSSGEGSTSSATWRAQRTADPRLLFRFSALTFNAHRIHYDYPYATGEEGYPGLVVHGPLQAILMVELVRANTERTIAGFEFRGLQPLFAGEAFEVCADVSGDAESLADAEARCEPIVVRVQRDGTPTASGQVRLS